MHSERDIEALLAWMERRRRRKFRWRRGSDCLSYAMGAVKAQTGVDLLADVPSWGSLREARALAAAEGGIAAALDARMERIAPAMAQRGDVAGLPDARFGVRLMVVEGRTLVGPGEHGERRLDRAGMTMAWRASSASVVKSRPAGDEDRP